MKIFTELKIAFRLAYEVTTFRDNRTHEDIIDVTVPRTRHLGFWRIAEQTIAAAPQGEIPYRVRVWADSLIDKDLEQLPWEDYYDPVLISSI